MVKTFTEEAYVLAADLGQSNDPTAICIMQHFHRIEMTVKGKIVRTSNEYLVRYLQRLPLGMSYVEQVKQIADLLRRPPLDKQCELVIDETGVGRAVGDLFTLLRVRPTRVVITAGENQTSRASCRWHVPKGVLISALDARLHTQELKIAPDLPEASALKEELRDFRRHISAAGRYSFEARSGKHDDLVLAVALALWNCTGRPKQVPAQIGTYGWGREITLNTGGSIGD